MPIPVRKADDSLIIAKRDLSQNVEPDPKKDPLRGWRHVEGARMTIAEARKAYDAGMVEMAHGRDGKFATLYAIPRKFRAERPHPRFAREQAAA